jgi:hypothetical protein
MPPQKFSRPNVGISDSGTWNSTKAGWHDVQTIFHENPSASSRIIMGERCMDITCKPMFLSFKEYGLKTTEHKQIKTHTYVTSQLPHSFRWAIKCAFVYHNFVAMDLNSAELTMKLNSNSILRGYSSDRDPLSVLRHKDNWIPGLASAQVFHYTALLLTPSPWACADRYRRCKLEASSCATVRSKLCKSCCFITRAVSLLMYTKVIPVLN